MARNVSISLTHSERLNKLLDPQDRIWAIVIDGIGGIGKSALALEVAHYYLKKFDMLPHDKRFDAIIWSSAKATFLTADGITTRQQVARTIEDIYKAISTTLNLDSISHAQTEEQTLLIHRALIQQRTLLIIDNLESIDDHRVNAFIRELPVPTKCIITTRHRIDIVDPIRLIGMPREDAIILIRQECSKKNVRLTDEQVNVLFRRTGGVPLAIVWSIAQMSYGYDIKSVLSHLGNAKGDIARYCFENAILKIKGKPAYDILISLAISKAMATRDYLMYVTELSKMDCIEGLVELEKLSLINKQINQHHGIYYTILSLVQEYSVTIVGEIPLRKLENLVIRITERYEPHGADAIAIIESIVGDSAIESLRNEAATMIIDALYNWVEMGDDYGVSICIGAFQSLATKNAIDALNSIAAGYGFIPVANYSADQEAIASLFVLKEHAAAIEGLKGFAYGSSYPIYDFLIDITGRYGTVEAIHLLEIISQRESHEDTLAKLKKAIKQIERRDQNAG